MPPDSPLLTSGLAHARALALLPEDADFAFLAVKDGDSVRVGVISRIGTNGHWQISADLGYKPSTQEFDGRVMVTGKF